MIAECKQRMADPVAAAPRGGRCLPGSPDPESPARSGAKGRSRIYRQLRILSPLLAITFPAACASFQPSGAAGDAEAPLIVTIHEDFQLPEPGEAWTFRTPELWHISTENDMRFLQMDVPPRRPILPGVRRPQEYAVYSRYQFRSFSLSCLVRIDKAVEVAARDACIIFGRQDDTHFYYAHLSGVADNVHNTLMRVDGDTRQRLLDHHPPPAITDKEWHRVDVLRDVDAGTIRVYVDAESEDHPPLFAVTDRTYEWGHIALGSFDDHASFANLVIQGEARRHSGVAPVSDVAPTPTREGIK
jgi:hypothetical protein